MASAYGEAFEKNDAAAIQETVEDTHGEMWIVLGDRRFLSA